jgi:hypothetical protein
MHLWYCHMTAARAWRMVALRNAHKGDRARGIAWAREHLKLARYYRENNVRG